MKKYFRMFLATVLCITALASCKSDLSENQSSLPEDSKEESIVSDTEPSIDDESIPKPFEGELTVDTTIGDSYARSIAAFVF